MTLASDALAVARAGIRAADPAAAVARVLRVRRGALEVGPGRLRAAPGGRCFVFAIGKAAGPMADAAARAIGTDVLGLVIPPHGSPAPRSDLPVRYGEHPVPGAGSRRAGSELLDAVRGTGPADAVVFLISGGGSAVAEVPLPPLSLGEVARTTRVLLGSGAAIGEMNAIRRHISAIKGGRLARATGSPRRATVAISDVVGDAPENIASGPTVPDPSRFSDAVRVVRRHGLTRSLPGSVVRWLREGRDGRHPETPKPDDPSLPSMPFVLAATNRTAVAAAAKEARFRGYRARIVGDPIVGETQPAARRFARQLVRRSGRAALLGGGETTVTLGPHPGRGGRNQEFALACVPVIAGRSMSVVLSIGTDGIDGPTDAAGGRVSDATARLAARAGVDVRRALREHAAYAALGRLGGLLRTGPTGTNVTDLHVGLRAPVRQSGYGAK